MAAVNLIDDISTGVVDTMLANPTFINTFIGDQTSQGLKVEYARDKNSGFLKGVNGLCTVYPADPDGELPKYGGSAFMVYRIACVFDIIEAKDDTSVIPMKKSLVQQAMISLFHDDGIEFFENFVDSGSNVLGGSGKVTLVSVEETPGAGRGPANVVIESALAVSFWHKVPLTIEV